MPVKRPAPGDLEAIETASRDEVQALQLKRLPWSLQHAYDNVAHYRLAFDAAGVHPSDCKTLADLARYPYTTKADLRAQYALSKRVRDRANDANEAVIGIRRVKAQLVDRLKKSSDAALKTVGDTLQTHVLAVEENIYQVRNQSGQDPLNFPIKVNNRLATLLSMVQRGDGPPTNNMPEIFDILSTELTSYTDRLKRVYATDLVAVNRELLRLKLVVLDPRCERVAVVCGPVP